ncbi:MAG: alpha/beta fold hydrolase [Candidatus Solibacter usitatus]|nr:alpha/beta fold hydrolase [Candidatus Solibacter usitatus]
MRAILLLLTAALGWAEEVYVKTVDGVFVPAVYRKPQGNGPFPAVLMLHGGVGGGGFPAAKNFASGRVPDALIQRGYAVLSSDYRRYHFGEDETQDAIAAYRHLESLPFVDKKRIAVLGSSHGGYLVLLMATRIRPAAVLSLAGSADIEATFYDLAQKARRKITSYDQWRAALLEGGGPFNEVPLELAWRFGDRRELFRDISPIHHLDKFSSPVLFLVGGKDNLRFTGKAFVDAMQAKGKPALYSEHEGMPHGFYMGREENPPKQFVDALQVMLEFLDKHVK